MIDNPTAYLRVMFTALGEQTILHDSHGREQLQRKTAKVSASQTYFAGARLT